MGAFSAAGAAPAGVGSGALSLIVLLVVYWLCGEKKCEVEN